jgi:hypothetical protein
MIQPPAALTAFLGGTAANFASAYGQLLGYKWCACSKTTLAGATLSPLPEGAHFGGTATPTLQITGIANSDATNFVVIITNPGGSITSAPVALTAIAAPAHTFVAYTTAGQVYAQNFNSLPIPGGSSAEGANPLHITYAMTNIGQMLLNVPYANSGMAAELQYSTANPMDFGFPIIPSGAIGGLGLGTAMGGWYGWAQNALVIAATKGDQSQGAVVDNGGIYYADGSPLSIITNRALGLIATAKTGPVAFGAALVNKTTNTYNTINLSFTGELWRNNPNAQSLLFGYFIDPAGTNSTFHPDQWDSMNGITYLPNLDVNFPTSANTLIFDGTQASNQIPIAVSGLTISNWPSGSTLWLIWQAQTLGSAQNLAIDNLSFAAGTVAVPTVTTQPASAIAPVNATLNARVNPNTLATTYYFQYGTSTAYGSYTTTNSLAAGLSAVSLANLVSGLQPGTAYHFRAVAVNSLGTSLGADTVFTTAQVNPPKLGGLALGGGGFQFGFTNWPGVGFTVWSTTNVMLPVSQWHNAGHPTEAPAGHYQFNDPQALTNSQLDYILTQP